MLFRSAIRLVDAGERVVLLESKKKLGGRATSFVDPRSGEMLDNWVDCVFSPEQAPRSADTCATPAATEFDAGAGLNCAGYGSSVAVTAGFGFAAAARVLAAILPA